MNYTLKLFFGLFALILVVSSMAVNVYALSLVKETSVSSKSYPMIAATDVSQNTLPVDTIVTGSTLARSDASSTEEILKKPLLPEVSVESSSSTSIGGFFVLGDDVKSYSVYDGDTRIEFELMSISASDSSTIQGKRAVTVSHCIYAGGDVVPCGISTLSKGESSSIDLGDKKLTFKITKIVVKDHASFAHIEWALTDRDSDDTLPPRPIDKEARLKELYTQLFKIVEEIKRLQQSN